MTDTRSEAPSGAVGSAEGQRTDFPGSVTATLTGPAKSAQNMDPLTPAAGGDLAPGIGTRQCNPARRYNHWLGEKDNFKADRDSADAMADLVPEVPTIAAANRRFLHRVVSLLAEAGVRQFVDIGCGIPMRSNTHDIAQATHPDARVVYVDHDAVVLAHARALMTSTPQGKVAVVDADLRQPQTILASTGFRETIDLTQPVAWLLLAVLHYLGDDTNSQDVVRQLLDASPEHSYVAISHATLDGLSARTAARLSIITNIGPTVIQPRSRETMVQLVQGLAVEPPGVCPVGVWGNPGEVENDQAVVGLYAVVARKQTTTSPPVERAENAESVTPGPPRTSQPGVNATQQGSRPRGMSPRQLSPHGASC